VVGVWHVDSGEGCARQPDEARVRQHARRLGGFILLPAMSMIASVVLLPLVSDQYGSAGWVTLALGQSIGAMASVVVSLAWPLTGGHEVASAGPAERKNIYRRSVTSRLTVLVGMLAITIPVTSLLTSTFPLAATLFMVGITLNGLTASWFYAGTGEPRYVVINEGLVRLGAYLVSVVGLLLGAGLLWYAAVMALSGFVMVGLNWRQVMGRENIFRTWDVRESFGLVRQQLAGTLARVLQALFGFGGPTLFSGFAPAALPLYAGLDQIQKAANNALGVVPYAFIGYVGSSDASRFFRRMARSMLLVTGLSVVAAVFWALAGPLAVRLLFSDSLEIPPGGHFLLTLCVLTVFLCRSFELLVMVPLGFEKAIYSATSVASVVGLILMAGAAVTFGALGGLAVWVVCHLGLLVYYGGVVVTFRRRLKV
jgi:hypothetical protein